MTWLLIVSLLLLPMAGSATGVSVHNMTSHLVTTAAMHDHNVSENIDNDDCGMSETKSSIQHDCCGPSDIMQDSCTHSDCHCDNLLHAPALGLLPPTTVNALQGLALASDYQSKPLLSRGETNYRPPILA